MAIHLYTEPGCSACVDAKRLLALLGISFEERDITSNPEYQRILSNDLDSCTTPTLIAGNEIVVGFDESAYRLLSEAHPLDTAMNSATDDGASHRTNHGANHVPEHIGSNGVKNGANKDSGTRTHNLNGRIKR